MRKVILIFPDVSSLAEFVLAFQISRALVDSPDKMLAAVMTDKSLRIACNIYGAKIKESIAIKDF